MLREASESERLELSRKLEDRFFNEERPYDKVSDIQFDNISHAVPLQFLTYRLLNYCS